VRRGGQVRTALRLRSQTRNEGRRPGLPQLVPARPRMTAAWSGGFGSAVAFPPKTPDSSAGFPLSLVGKSSADVGCGRHVRYCRQVRATAARERGQYRMCPLQPRTLPATTTGVHDRGVIGSFVKGEAAHLQSASSQAWQSSEAQTGVSHAAYRNSRNALSRYRRTPS
jgi:hypothetical protein